MTEKWWSSGVKFRCQDSCGRCCDEPGGIVYLSREDTRRISKHFELKPKTWLKRDAKRHLNGKYILKSNKDDGICIFLNSKKQCEIYQVRPQQCAAFPWWSENLRTERAWLETKAHCPGIEAEDAFLVEANEIQFHVNKDIVSSKGFRVW